MRALTLTQPWASLVASGVKLVENRPQPTISSADFGRRFAIHASREIDTAVYPYLREHFSDLFGDPLEMNVAWNDWRLLAGIKSAVIGVAVVETVVFDKTGMLYGDIKRQLGAQHRWWNPSQFGYVLREAVTLRKPIPCRGWQGFWTLAPEIERAILEQIAPGVNETAAR